jgi:pSer/pThr/pTyr-binding forkhead associated (FHA) protein
MDAKLIAVSGTRAKAEFPLFGDSETIVGRDPENAVVISDAQVSRRHVALRMDDHRWFARDLGSANGTELNGLRIQSERQIRDGDLLVVGGTKLEFIYPGEPRTVPQKRLVLRMFSSRALGRRRWLISATGVALVIVALALALERGRSRERARLEEQQRRLQTKRQEAELAFQRGKSLIRAGNWLAAKAELEQVERVDPDFSNLSEYKRRTETEIPNQQYLAEAEEALGKDDLGRASQALARVSADSLQYERLGALQVALNEKAGSKLRQAQAELEAEDFARTADLAKEVLRVFPADSDARYFDAVASQALKKERRARPVKASTPPGPVVRALERFTAGDFAAAIALADSCARTVTQCAALAKRTREFHELNQRVDSLDVDHLRRLIALDREITGGRGSSWCEKAKLRLSGMLLRQASAAQSAQEWGKAGSLAKEAVRIDPTNASASAILEEAKGKARDIYLSGYGLRETESDAAVAKFKEVLQLTSPSDENYQRAKFWLEKLSNEDKRVHGRAADID